MQPTKTKTLRYYLKWILWILVVQIVLSNVSAAIYAYRFTHFYEGRPSVNSRSNIFQKTWKLFTGPKFYKLTDEPVPAFPCETIRIKTHDQVQLDAWYGETSPSKGCVIFFHGVTVNKGFVLGEAMAVRRWGFNVLIVDFRGHGKSEGHVTSFGVDETEDVEAAFEAAIAHGNKKIILFGTSLGAVAVLKAVAEHKVQPAGLIAEMPFDNMHHHFEARARNLGFPEQPFAFLVTAWIGIERGFQGFKHDAVKYASHINCPVLLQWGEKDRYVSRGQIEKVYAGLQSGQKELVSYPLADHESLLHADPVLWQKKVQSFLEALH